MNPVEMTQILSMILAISFNDIRIAQKDQKVKIFVKKSFFKLIMRYFVWFPKKAPLDGSIGRNELN